MSTSDHEGADPIPTGERMVWEVPSSRRKGVKYRVDLLANSGAGWCACPDFRARRQGAQDRGEPVLTRPTSCRHLRKTWRYFLSSLLRKMAEEEEGNGR